MGYMTAHGFDKERSLSDVTLHTLPKDCLYTIFRPAFNLLVFCVTLVDTSLVDPDYLDPTLLA